MPPPDTARAHTTFPRLLFVLLVALNIIAGAWVLLGHPYRRVPPATDPGVPELQLLSQSPATAASATSPAATDAPANTASAPVVAAAQRPADRCMTLGPFATPAAARQARTALATQVLRSRTRQTQGNPPGDWWVYLATSGRAQAQALATRLGARGIRDYAIGSVGDQPDTISLGVYGDQARARQRRAELVAAGFSPLITQRTGNTTRYWLDLVAAHDSLDWRARIHVQGIGASAIGCF